MPERRVYKVVFHHHGQVWEIYAQSVSQGGIFGFVEVENLLFGERSSVVVDPTEETIKNEFKEVRRIYLPMHAIIRIDEVEKEGVSRITPRAKGEGNVTPFPALVPTRPGDKPGGS